MTLGEALPELAVALAERYGVAPGATSDDPFIRLITAFLASHLDSRNVAETLRRLRDAGLLGAADLAAADPTELVWVLSKPDRVRRPGWLAPLRRLARWVADHSDALADLPTTTLREKLLELRGLGPATVDRLLLCGLDRAVAPVDRAVYRILVRHGWIDTTADYEDARLALEGAFSEEDAPRLTRLIAGLEQAGRDYCRAAAPRCEDCPLHRFLPEAGPAEPGP